MGEDVDGSSSSMLAPSPGEVEGDAADDDAVAPLPVAVEDDAADDDAAAPDDAPESGVRAASRAVRRRKAAGGLPTISVLSQSAIIDTCLPVLNLVLSSIDLQYTFKY